MWKGSKKPPKQRKFLAKAPIHIKKNQLSVNLSKELRKGHNKRNVVVRKGDTVKIMRGKFAKKTGKIKEVKIKTGKIYIEGIQTQKGDGSKADVPIKASNLQIIELYLEDKKRFKRNKNEVKKIDKEKKENAPKKTKNA